MARAAAAVGRFETRLPQGVAFVLAVLIGLQLALLVANARITRMSAPPATSPAAANGGTVAALVQQITTANLFGASAPAGIDEAVAALTLSGVIAGEDARQGIAILGPDAAQARAYVVGAEVTPGTVLRAVYADGVELERQGRVSRLALPRRTDPGAANGTPGATAVAATVPQGDVPGLLGGTVNAQRTRGGYRVVAADDVQALQRLGLRSGDVVTHVNGASLADPKTSERLLQDMAEVAQTVVTVRRGGRERELTLDLRGLAAAASERRSLQAAMEAVPPGDPVTRRTPRAAPAD